MYPLETFLGAVGGGLAGNALTKAAPYIRFRIYVATRKLASKRTAKLRDTDWIKNASENQLKKKFKHAIDFGIKGNQNKQNLNAYKEALKTHVKSSDTIIIQGTYRGKVVTHYFNTKNFVNVIKDSKGQFSSSWKLTRKQIYHLFKNGKIGGGK